MPLDEQQKLHSIEYDSQGNQLRKLQEKLAMAYFKPQSQQ
jgi:hypothetical protein